MDGSKVCSIDSRDPGYRAMDDFVVRIESEVNDRSFQFWSRVVIEEANGPDADDHCDQAGQELESPNDLEPVVAGT